MKEHLQDGFNFDMVKIQTILEEEFLYQHGFWTHNDQYVVFIQIPKFWTSEKVKFLTHEQKNVDLILNMI